MTALSAFRVGSEPTTPPEPRRRPLSVDRLGHGMVCSWDQSIRKTAWCLILRDEAGCRVLDAGMCRTTASEGKITWATRLPDQAQIFEQARLVLRRLLLVWPGMVVAHESPPQGGGMIHDPFSSALAAAALWSACADLGVTPVLLANQSAKMLLTGDRKASKPDIARAVRGLGWLGGVELLTNEDKRDAAAIGLKWLETHGRRA